MFALRGLLASFYYLSIPQAQFISQCMAEIKKELKQENGFIKANAVSKLTYVRLVCCPHVLVVRISSLPPPPILTSRDALPSLRLLFLIIACFCISVYASPLPLSSPSLFLTSSPVPSSRPLPFPHLFYCPFLTSSPALSSPLPLPFPHLFPCPFLTSSPVTSSTALSSPLPLPFPHLFYCPFLTSSTALSSPLLLPFPHLFYCPFLTSSTALSSPLLLPFPHLFYCPFLTSSTALSSPLLLPFPHLFYCLFLTSSPALPSPLPLSFPHLFPCPSLTSSPALSLTSSPVPPSSSFKCLAMTYPGLPSTSSKL